jgi:hypothetical protein
MKAYTIKSSGATIASNILWEVRHDLKSDDWFHTGIIFFRKKDAKKYLETLKYKKLYEIVALNIDKVKQDNRLTNKQENFLTWYTTGNNKHYVGDKLIEAYKKEVLNM